MNAEDVIPHQFAALFAGNGHAYGSEEGGCIREPVTIDVIKGHLFGDTPIGMYPIWKDHVGWGCVDYDEGEEVSQQKAWRLVGALGAIGIPAYCERSRSKGWHVWVFAARPVPAATMRRALLAATAVADAESKEVNPKQERLPEGSLGNYVRLPYPNTTRSEARRVVFDHDTHHPLTLEEFLATVQKASPAHLEQAAACWFQPETSEVSRAELNPIEDNDEVRVLIDAMPGDAFVIWRDGPLEGSDRSSTLLRFAGRLEKSGAFTAEEAHALIASADRRWGKYHLRPDGGDTEVSKIVRGFRWVQR